MIYFLLSIIVEQRLPCYVTFSPIVQMLYYHLNLILKKVYKRVEIKKHILVNRKLFDHSKSCKFLSLLHRVGIGDTVHSE